MRRYLEEGTEMPNGQVIEDTGWHVYMGNWWHYDVTSQRADGVDDRDPIERYGTVEHEMWLIEMERRNDYQ